MIFIPAYIALIPEKSLEGYGHSEEEKPSKLAGFLRLIGRFAVSKYKLVIFILIIAVGISIWGILKINVNDNPVKWFVPEHEIRVADKVLNKHFSGTYMAYLTIDAKELPEKFTKEQEQEEFDKKENFFKDPHNLKIIEELDEYIVKNELAGKVNTIADVIKKIGYELYKKDPAYRVIPDNSNAVAQYLFLYESSGNPDDLYHLVDYSYTKVNLWIQLKSGDNKEVQNVVNKVEQYLSNKKFTGNVSIKWAGLTYINVEWQKKMVWGMLNSLASSFVIVFIMMAILFKSVLFGLYGVIGIMGKDYDMPVAVLSSLTLGLSVDFAIHFIERLNELKHEKGNLNDAMELMFDEPARAITRNAIVIAIGFLPLLLATLVPYQTVGFFLATIMAVSGISTLVIIPAFAIAFQGILYPNKETAQKQE
jgi:predicted RND superfamily exporter protein